MNKCKCGCGLETNSKCGFYKGHWNKGRKRPDSSKRLSENHPMRDSTLSKKIWETRRINGYITWNKGLSKTSDNRVKSYSEKRNKNLDIISKKISETKKKKYKSGEIVPYWKNKNRKIDESFIEKMRISSLNRILKQGKNISFNPKSIKFFEKLNNEYKLKGLFGINEFKCIGYSLDFYSKKYNIVIEWDEEFHYKNDLLRNKDIIRQEKIINYLNCKFIRIREKFIDNFDYLQIKNIINE